MWVNSSVEMYLHIHAIGEFVIIYKRPNLSIIHIRRELHFSEGSQKQIMHFYLNWLESTFLILKCLPDTPTAPSSHPLNSEA